jgi:peptidoglycan hydrolase-like protein with peptidoglycan-binding domain
MIEHSVGVNGRNGSNDVLIIQSALNVWRVKNGRRLIALDGIIGPKTIGAIFDFQRSNNLGTDGRIDANGPTLARVKVLLGSEAVIFAPIVTGMLEQLDVIIKVSFDAPSRVQLLYTTVIMHVSRLRRYNDLSNAGLLPASFVPRSPVIGAVVIDDAIEGMLALAALGVAIAAMLLIMINSPAFRKAVEARAKELDRILGELKIHMAVKFEEVLTMILSIADETIDAGNKCRQSPTFNPSPECLAEIKLFTDLIVRIRNMGMDIARWLLLFNWGRQRGFSVHTLRTMINGLLNRLSQNVFDLQVSLQQMRDKCNCPEV